ncbi:hypothetical protein DB346_03405 [Verrucomicrobia bacterium LW23]|nr:hypothetical protein DB346_03405 [Verrucomicrobia bacterium LW23]
MVASRGTVELYGRRGAPTLDFVVVCPIPLTLGTCWLMDLRRVCPYDEFVFELYFFFVAFFRPF